MEEKGTGNLSVNPQTLLVVIAVCVNLFWLKELPFKPSRPYESPGHDHPSAGGQDVEARLWQDPFEAIVTQEKRALNGRSETNRHKMSNLAEQIRSRCEA